MATVLIVDDTASCRDPMARLLRRQGYTPLCAANGREALDTLVHNDVDLILLDLMMPIMDGVEMLRELRSDPAHSAMPVIVLTAVPFGDAVSSVRQLGVDTVLPKAQFSLDELLDAMARHVDGGHA